MRYLLDTHVFLWMLMAPDRLSPSVIEVLENPGNPVFVSAVTSAEIAIKTAMGKLRLETDENKEVTRRGLLHLPLSFEQTLRLKTLPPIHRDPFDRLLIAQALHEELTLVTGDAAILKYPVAALQNVFA